MPSVIKLAIMAARNIEASFTPVPDGTSYKRKSQGRYMKSSDSE